MCHLSINVVLAWMKITFPSVSPLRLQRNVSYVNSIFRKFKIRNYANVFYFSVGVSSNHVGAFPLVM